MKAEEILKQTTALVTGTYIFVGHGKGGACFAQEFDGEDYNNFTIIPKANLKNIKRVK
jgi:hypothetical protein